MIKEKKEKKLSFRLTEQEYSYLEKSAFAMGSTPSKFVRQLIQMAINASIQAEQQNEKMRVAKEASQLADH